MPFLSINFHKVANYQSESCLLTAFTYNYISLVEMGPNLLFPIVLKYYQVTLYFKDFRYVHCLYLSARIYQSQNIFVSTLMNQFNQ